MHCIRLLAQSRKHAVTVVRGNDPYLSSKRSLCTAHGQDAELCPRLHTKTLQAAACAEATQDTTMPSIWDKKLGLQQFVSFSKVAGKDPSFGEQ